MYLGEFICKLDSKGRLYIPSEFRKDIDKLVLTYIDENTIMAFKNNNWDPSMVLGNTCIDNLNINKYLNYIKSNSFIVEMDPFGRITLPLIFRKKISFNKECIVSGNIDHFKLCNKEKYYYEQEILEREFNQFLNSNKGISYRKK